MSLLDATFRFLAEPRLRGVDMDADDRIAVHREILSQKPMLEGVFREFYDLCRELDDRHFSGEGMRLEIGAGVSLFKQHYPEVISTDIKSAPHLDRALDAQQMDLPDASVRAIYGINCFHHFPDPEQFFHELERVLVPGGGCVLIDPYFGPVAAQFYKRVFKTEHFDASQSAWRSDEVTGPMRGANQALSYVVFVRDAERFRAGFPRLEVVEQRPLHNYVRYLASGGLNFRALVPNQLTFGLKSVEALMSPLARLLALHHVIVLRKRT